MKGSKGSGSEGTEPLTNVNSRSRTCLKVNRRHSAVHSSRNRCASPRYSDLNGRKIGRMTLAAAKPEPSRRPVPGFWNLFCLWNQPPSDSAPRKPYTRTLHYIWRLRTALPGGGEIWRSGRSGEIRDTHATPWEIRDTHATPWEIRDTHATP